MKARAALFVAVTAVIVRPGLHSVDVASGDVVPGTSDFAQCPLELPACTDTLTSCCKRPFDPIGQDRAIVIPMDRCHQQVANGGAQSPPGEASPAWCREMGTRQDDGMMHAYGLVYRLMQRGIPVYWIINPTKDPQGRGSHTARDIDLWILGAGAASPPAPGAALTACPLFACDAPVFRLSPGDLSPLARYDRQEFPIRGSAWIIAPEDRPAFEAFWASGDYDFSEVDLYEVASTASLVYQAFDRPAGGAWEQVAGAPIALRVDYAPPRLAKLTGGPSDNWLRAAKLDQRAENADCLTAPFVPADAVYCDITQSDVSAGRLNTADVGWAWMDHGGFGCDDVDQFREFLSARDGVPGKSVLFMEAVISDVESCPGKEIAGRLGAGLATRNAAVGGPFIQRYPANLMMQFGDIEADFAQGSVSGWYASGDGSGGYEPRGSLVRLVTKDAATACPGNASTPACDTADDRIDLLAYVRHLDDPENGLAMYAPGNNITQQGNRAHLRAVLNALIALPTSGGQILEEPDDELPPEISRATPIVAPTAETLAAFQGSFEYQQPLPPPSVFESASDADTFVFPRIRGHFRAVPTSALTESAQPFESPSALFDVAEGRIPAANPGGCGLAAFSSGCRSVFTNVAGGVRPPRVLFDLTSAATLEPLLESGLELTPAEVETLIARVLAGAREGDTWVPALGGIDRSTTAVIGASPVAGADRPTMAYVGALDGMLHAICAEVAGPCEQLGQELWAYVPRSQLGHLRSNTQRIDGSPVVVDVLLRPSPEAPPQWATVLTFLTGSGDPSDAARAPSINALDISNPGDPRVLWELPLAGLGLGAAVGPVRVGPESKMLAFASTNRGGAAAGITVYAIDVATGEVAWTFDRTYPAGRAAETPAVPGSGIPAAPSAIDLDGSGTISHVAVPTLYGSLWMLDATDGSSVYGDRPLFSFSTDHHPIGASVAVYRDAASVVHAAFGSGGYADPLGLTAWSPASEPQYVVSVSLETPLANVPVDETSEQFVAFVDELDPGQRVFAAPTIAGNELFVVSDGEDVNDLTQYGSAPSGLLSRYGLADGERGATATPLVSGAASVEVEGATVYAGAGAGMQAIDVSDDFDDEGARVELSSRPEASRLLYLRSQ